MTRLVELARTDPERFRSFYEKKVNQGTDLDSFFQVLGFMTPFLAWACT